MWKFIAAFFFHYSQNLGTIQVYINKKLKKSEVYLHNRIPNNYKNKYWSILQSESASKNHAERKKSYTRELKLCGSIIMKF